MFPSPELFAELAGREVVALDDHPFALLLAAHHAAESSGMLAARRGQIEKKVLLERGVPVDCRSNLVHETLSRYLVEVGKLTDAESNTALGRSTATGRLLGEMLVEEGTLHADELQRILQQNLARKLFDLFAWREGEARFEAGEFRSETAQRLKVPRLIVTGVVRFAPQEVIDRQVAAFGGHLIARAADYATRALEVRPTGREQALIDQLESVARIEELMARLEAPPEEISRLIWAFGLVGLIDLADNLPRTPAKTPRPAPQTADSRKVPADSQPGEDAATGVPADSRPGGGTESASPAAEPDAAGTISAILRQETARLRERVRSAQAAQKNEDPFEILGLADDAPIEEIRDQFIEFARDLGPWQFGHPNLIDIAGLSREVFFSGAIAFARLADSKERESIRMSRRARRQSSVHESRGSYFRIETDLLDAEAQFAKGVVLKGAGKWDLALQQFDFAVDCDPQKGDYRAEAAYARFRLSPSQMASRVIEELREAQRVDPRSAISFLYAGEICIELARFAEAEKHLRTAARLLGPLDRRALDALAQLGQRKRKKR